jgi:aminoglycoside phosphotransferase (APT) family kinase protein
MDPIVIDALWGDAGLAGVQWMLLNERPHGVLRRALESLLPDAATLGACRLHRAKYKPGRHLTTYYEVALHDPATGREGRRQIEVTWMPAGAADPRGDMAELLKMQAEAVERGLAAPFRDLMAEVPSWGMRVQVAPLDIRFPQLARASDPLYVGEILAAAGAALGGADVAVTAIRYRPGQRHVLRYDAPGDTVRTTFAKVYNSDKGARTFGVVTRVADWLAVQDGGLRTVKPQAYVAGDGVVLYPLVTGMPLSDLLHAPDQTTARLLGAAGTALAALHRTPLDLVELQPHSFAKEVKSVVSAAEHVHPLLPETGARIDAILDRARALHERLPQEAPGFAYGDFKADHLWDTPDGLTLIDFDTCYLFDPAIDLGKFLADLHYWYDVYGRSGVETAREQFLGGYGPGATQERMLRARLYEALVLLKTTVRRVKLFERDWATRTERLVGRVDAVLAQLEDAVV